MSDRDPRWERVQGGISRWAYPGDDEPSASKITIEVVGPSGHRVGHTLIVTDEMRAHAMFDPYPSLLDTMVRKLDEALHA